MSQRTDWKPGTVAMVTFNDGPPVKAWVTNELCWETERQSAHISRVDIVTDVRPLAVIDYENVEQAAFLKELWFKEANNGSDSRDRFTERMQRALREYANPTPPKPTEPTGLGAVVKDRFGVKWVLLPEGVWQRESGGNQCRWAGFDAVEVLSEGVF